MDALVVAVLLSPLLVGIAVLLVVMAKRDRAAGRSSVMPRQSSVSRYSPEDVQRVNEAATRLGVTGGIHGPF